MAGTIRSGGLAPLEVKNLRFFLTRKRVRPRAGPARHAAGPARHAGGFIQHYFFSRKSSAGFTLIELLVVSAIVIIITSFMLFSQSKFNSSTLLRGLTYSVALSVRQAQVYGTSILGVSDPSLGVIKYASGYGLFFNVVSTAPTESYVLFADLDSNNQYDAPGEVVKTFSIRKGYTISRICAIAGTAINCSDDPDPITSLLILYKRPNPDAQFYARDVSGPVDSNYDSAYIQVRSADGTFRSILITATGQIVVQPPGTPP